MSKTYRTIGMDCAVVVARDDEDYGAGVRVKVSDQTSRVLKTHEIGELAAHLALVYYRRTGNITMFSEPDRLESDCVFCDGTCDGSCIE